MLWVLGGAALAEEINLTLQDAPLTVIKGSTVTRKINGIPQNTPGIIKLRIKWHAMTLVPNTFNKLRIELLHGTRVLETRECYSVHSDKDPKCYVWKSVDQTEANASGDWKLRVTNNSNYDVNGFNILKELTDLNPAVMLAFVESVFEPDCSTRYLSMQQGGDVDIAPYSTVERELYGVRQAAGELRIRAKWHTGVITPNVFRALTVELLRNGAVVRSDYGYSIHSDQTDKLDIRINNAANQERGWKLRISNRTGLQINDFDIEKGGDLNPFVPSFRSTYKPSCN
jgi:hypothetical protein